MGYSTLLINNLEIRIIFKNKVKEEGMGITDLINRIVQVFKEDLERLAIRKICNHNTHQPFLYIIRIRTHYFTVKSNGRCKQSTTLRY